MEWGYWVSASEEWGYKLPIALTVTRDAPWTINSHFKTLPCDFSRFTHYTNYIHTCNPTWNISAKERKGRYNNTIFLGKLTQKTLNTRFNPTTISLNKTINKHLITVTTHLTN